MSSYNCCSSQKPPSPESLPSRPVKLSTGGAIAVASWSTASRLSKPEDVAELRALFKGDNSDVERNGSRVITVKRSASTLDVVKSKLRKHLSRESALSKHRPRSTVGNSEEEIQRRKELRLIRDRRIKEELSSEGAYDDDAKSLSSVTIGKSPRKPWPMIHSEHMDFSEPLEANPRPLFMRKSADGFYVQKSSPVAAKKRRHSFAVLDSPMRLTRTAVDWVVCRDDSNVKIPPTPLLKPQKLPSIVDAVTRRTSWRLSFASDQRAFQLRALSHEYDLSSSATGPGTRGTFAGPLKWFRGQVTHAPPSTITNVPDHFNVRDNPRKASRSLELDNYQDLDGNIELRKAPISLLDMRISQRLASRGLHSHSSSPQLSSWGSHSHYRSRSYNSEVYIHNATSQPKYHQSASNSAIFESKVSMRWGDLLPEGISYIYASTETNANAFPESSISNPPSTPVTDKGIKFSSGQSQENTTAFQALPLFATDVDTAVAKPLLDSHSTPSARQNRRYAIDDAAPGSESLGFSERGAELATAKVRSPKAFEKSSQRPFVRSKFNEEFGQKQIATLRVPGEKPSLSTLLKLHRFGKLVSRSYDDLNPFERQVPSRQGFGYTFSNMSHSTASTEISGSKNPGTIMSSSPIRDPLQIQGNNAKEVWALASRRMQEEYGWQHVPESCPIDEDLKNRPESFLGIRSLSWKLKGKKRAVTDSSKDIETETLPSGGIDFKLEKELCHQARKVEIETANADEWEDELEVRERQAKAKTVAVGQRACSPSSRSPPESWARFPSHTRDDRNASAGIPDHVSAKDFAIKNLKNGIVEWMTSDRKYQYHHHKKEQHHSLPIRVSRQIRASLYKLRTTKSTAMSDAIHGRKSSVSVEGKLEFPELEIPAGEISGEGLYDEIVRETEKRMRKNEKIVELPVFGEDGNNGEVDVKGSINVLEGSKISEISIADPRFYDDCVTLPLEDDDEIDNLTSSSGAMVVPVGKMDLPKLENGIIEKDEYQTGSGRDRTVEASMGRMALRRSSQDFQRELEMIEGLEKDRVIKSAEEAWGESAA